MITRHKLDNNVRCVLSAGISAVDTSVTLVKASSPYRDPPPPDTEALDMRGVLTFMDSLTNPTKIEIVTYETLIDNGNGTITLGNLIRGVESTVASAFSGGQHAIQTISAAELNTPLMTNDHSLGRVTFPGIENRLPAAVIGDFGAHVLAYWPSQPIITLGPNTTDPNDQDTYLVRLAGGDGFFDIFLRRTGELVGNQSILRADYDSYSATNRPVVKIADLDVHRIENNDAISRSVYEMGMATTQLVDWQTHDTIKSQLSNNTTVTFRNINPYPGGADKRKLRWIIATGGSNPGYTVTMPSNLIFPDGVSPPAFTGSNKWYVIDMYFAGTPNIYLAESVRTYSIP